ncbi:HAD family hydrolase [Corynebacterium sp. A21]|uniref:HAD family hydrolase n=1 Tax=Corynebacterium sp. A21 TaxID=3457318 RepID=UPI003FCF37D4
MSTPSSALRGFIDRSQAIIFDFNGTLSDDETELEQAYGEALLDMGLPALTAPEYAAQLGKSEPDIAAALTQARTGSTTRATELLDLVSTRYIAICAESPRVSERSVELVHHLVDQGKQVAIVTGTLSHLIRPVLEQRDILRRLSTLITIEDVSRGKPDPEGFLTAADRIGMSDHSRILVFEDSRAGVAAATAAGMPSVGIGLSSGAALAFATMDEAAQIILGSDH